MMLVTRSSSAPPNTGPAQFFSALDHNQYHRPTRGMILFNWTDAATTYYKDFTLFQAEQGLEAHGVDLIGAVDPFFEDAARGDYRVRAGSSASGSAVPLPADVAARLGVPAGAALDHGALRWVDD